MRVCAASAPPSLPPPRRPLLSSRGARPFFFFFVDAACLALTSLNKAGVSRRNLFEEVPITIRNSALVNAFVDELEERQLTLNFDQLEVGARPRRTNGWGGAVLAHNRGRPHYLPNGCPEARAGCAWRCSWPTIRSWRRTSSL